MDRSGDAEGLHVYRDCVVEADEDPLLLGMVGVAENLLPGDDPTDLNARRARLLVAQGDPREQSPARPRRCRGKARGPLALDLDPFDAVGSQAHGRLIVGGEPEGIASLCDLAEVAIVDVVGDHDVSEAGGPRVERAGDANEQDNVGVPVLDQCSRRLLRRPVAAVGHPDQHESARPGGLMPVSPGLGVVALGRAERVSNGVEFLFDYREHSYRGLS